MKIHKRNGNLVFSTANYHSGFFLETKNQQKTDAFSMQHYRNGFVRNNINISFLFAVLFLALGTSFPFLLEKMFPKVVGIFLCYFATSSQVTTATVFSTQPEEECALIDDVAVVVASLGRSNADGDPEDLSWLDRRKVKLTKDIYVYQRSHPKRPNFIGTMNGNECLTYLTYIKDNYYSLPSAVIFIHADASRHCPLISNVLQLPNEVILRLLKDPEREIPGYLALSKVFLNQTKTNLEKFKYPLISFSNYVQKEKYKFRKHNMDSQRIGGRDSYISGSLPADKPAAPRLSPNEEKRNSEEYSDFVRDLGGDEIIFPFTAEYPEYITTYTSGSFIVSKENILSYPLHFYEQLSQHLFAGGRTCGYLEYLWSTLCGGGPFSAVPDSDRSCGPLFYTDISTSRGFEFFGSDDGSVEGGRLPDGYRGHILPPR
jgi:hypothetical protein